MGMFLANLWPLAVYFLAVILLVVAMISISYVLGERHRGRATDDPYEAGAPITGSARQKLTPKFYLVAMFFVIFDLEAVFILAWALAARALGWPGYIEISIFIGVLLAGLVYLWRLGALDWGPRK
jgi:NADH-quinone oxidoreductase subunit A